ncbi:kinase [Marinobacter sp. OP 3.4]|uniref:kinase n=1 Tax=Marinobacter sp. OP 3.4 TaxID=3076501 RepID=UPI002E2510C0
MSQREARFTIRSLIATAVVSIIATVAVLEMSGRISHSDNKDHVPVGEFEAIHITPDQPFRMSSRSSELHAVCQDGYLAIAADADPGYQGILVDYKNRGVRCHPTAIQARE